MAKLNNDKKSVTVQAGDTLSEIAKDYAKYSNNATWQQLAVWNNIAVKTQGSKTVAYIYPKQVIKLYCPSASASTPNRVSNRVRIDTWARNASNMEEVFVIWSWPMHTVTDKYSVVWYYRRDGVGIEETQTESTTEKYAVFTPPKDAYEVAVGIKPVVKDHYKNTYIGWRSITSSKLYISPIPDPPSSINVTIDGDSLTATVDNVTDDASFVCFQLYKDDAASGSAARIAVKAGSASKTWNIALGHTYKVRCYCRTSKGVDGEWSPYTASYATRPSKVVIATCEPIARTDGPALSLTWQSIAGANSYKIEYSTNENDFDQTGNVTSVTATGTQYIITDVKVETAYYFRVRGTNDTGDGDWSDITSGIVSSEPAIPTTWSSSTVVGTNEKLILYWVHNGSSSGESDEKKANIVVCVDGIEVVNIEREKPESETKLGIISSYEFKMVENGSPIYPDGATLEWQVKTAGTSNTYSKWSTKRTVSIYAQPEISLSVSDATGTVLGSEINYQVVEIADGVYDISDVQISSPTFLNNVLYDDGTQAYTNTGNKPIFYGKTSDGEYVYYCSDTKKLESLPISVTGSTYPDKQIPISYHLVIIADDEYETTDDVGNTKVVVAGSEVYSVNIDSSKQLSASISASDVTLEDGIPYVLKCTVAMDSGLTAEASYPFVVDWVDPVYEPTAEVYIDTDAYTATIYPYCSVWSRAYYVVTLSAGQYIRTGTITIGAIGSPVYNAYTTTGEQVYRGIIDDGSTKYYCEAYDSRDMTDVLLSVYRRSYDGSFVELAVDLDGALNNGVFDPHPALDYARYRIVAKSKTTGAVCYSDIPAVQVGGKEIVIQWDEASSVFDTYGDDLNSEAPSSSSILKLPYNVDVSSNNDIDVTFIEYIGRSHPISYHGTHLGETASWSTEIPKSDKETIYALRRLAKWLGNAYVREPSGTGYWAVVSVSFSEKHLETTIPVTFDITRVEGGA